MRGHQREKGVRDLEWWAQMNDKVDSDAKRFLAVCCMGRSPRLLCPVRLLYENLCLGVNGKKLSSIDRTSLYETLFAPRLYCYWEATMTFPFLTALLLTGPLLLLPSVACL